MNSITSDQRRQYNRLVADAARKALTAAGSDKDSLQRLFGRGGEFQEYLATGIRQFGSKQPDYTLAKSILGTDFITAEEIMTARPDVVYSPEQIAQLAATIPSETTLALLKENGYGLMPQPPQASSLLAIRAAKSGHFYSKTGGWYEGVPFAQNDLTGTRWLAIKKTPVNGSLSKTWGDQVKLITNVEYVPNAAEASWFITIFFDVRGVRLFENMYVRTSSIGSGGDRVNVGGFDAWGLGVGNDWDGSRNDVLGLACARKF